MFKSCGGRSPLVELMRWCSRCRIPNSSSSAAHSPLPEADSNALQRDLSIAQLGSHEHPPAGTDQTSLRIPHIPTRCSAKPCLPTAAAATTPRTSVINCQRLWEEMSRYSGILVVKR